MYGFSLFPEQINAAGLKHVNTIKIQYIQDVWFKRAEKVFKDDFALMLKVFINREDIILEPLGLYHSLSCRTFLLD